MPSAFSPTVLTLPSTGGTGQGELNLVLNSVGASDATGWVGATRQSSGGPLNPTVGTYFTLSAANSASENSTSGSYYSFTLPSGLQNRKLKVEFYYTSVATDVVKVSVYKGTTRVPLSTDSSGSTTLPASTTGKFTAYFDTDSSGSWSVNVTRTSGSGAALQFTQVVVGPGIQPQGAVVGEWNVFSSPTIFGSTTNPTKGATIFADVMYWRRVGSAMELRYQYRQQSAGTAGSGNYQFPIPAGLTIDSAAIHSIGTSALPVFGSAFMGDATYLSGSVIPASSTRLSLIFPAGGGTAGNAVLGSGSTGYNLANANSSYGFEATIPIAEWAGSGTVQLAQNDVEYASNSVGDLDANDTTSFAYGPSGSYTPRAALTLNRTRRVRFQSPIQPTDSFSVEIYNYDSQRWSPIGTSTTINNAGNAINGYIEQGTLTYGYGRIRIVNTTDIDVEFGQYRSLSSSSYAAAGASWSTFSGTEMRWRVRKSSAGAAVGFGIHQPGVSSGLVSASGLVGRTDGLAVPSGYVGEVQSTSSTTAWTTGNTTVATLPLTAGRWLVSAYSQLAADTTNRYLRAWVNTSASVPSPQENKAPYNAYGISPGIGSVIISNALFDIPTGGGNIQLTVTTSSISGLTASYHFLNAVRIA